MTAHGHLVPGREPDVIVVGAGTFGSVLAWRLGQNRPGMSALVLEAGALGRTAHVQNAPVAAETVPPPRLLEPGAPAPADGGRWRVPWRSTLPYQGLAYGVGGRSLFWGAYCVPPLLDQDGIRERWPAGVADELRARYLPEAAELLGLLKAVPYFDGPLNRRLRERLLDGLAADRLPGVWTPGELPGHPAFPDPGRGDAERLNMPMAIDVVHDPESGSPRLVRFSSVPLLNERLRDGSDSLELITDCQVTGLRSRDGRVRVIETSRGRLRVPDHAVVVLAVGTIENARLVLDSSGTPGPPRVPHRLTTHLRSNLTVRVPFPFDEPDGWGAAALHLRGSCAHPDGPDSRFHHQITAYGVGWLPDQAARRLYRDTPRHDVEALDRALREPPAHLVVTLASVGEMADASAGEVGLLDERDEFGTPRAGVRLAPGARDERTWEAMDRSADAALRVLLGDQPYEVLRLGSFVPHPGGATRPPLTARERREPLGCGHHEMGTLSAGDDPARSHTDADGRTHTTRNLYVAGPAVFPALDSAGPVLPGIALTLRLADHLRRTVRREPVPRTLHTSYREDHVMESRLPGGS